MLLNDDATLQSLYVWFPKLKQSKITTINTRKRTLKQARKQCKTYVCVLIILTVTVDVGVQTNPYKTNCRKHYLTNRFHVALLLFSNRPQMTSKCSKNKKVAHEAISKSDTDVLTTFWRLLWSITEQTHGRSLNIAGVEKLRSVNLQLRLTLEATREILVSNERSDNDSGNLCSLSANFKSPLYSWTWVVASYTLFAACALKRTGNFGSLSKVVFITSLTDLKKKRYFDVPFSSVCVINIFFVGLVIFKTKRWFLTLKQQPMLKVNLETNIMFSLI